MRKFMLFAALAAAFSFASCDPADNQQEIDAVKLLSFGFYAEDNKVPVEADVTPDTPAATAEEGTETEEPAAPAEPEMKDLIYGGIDVVVDNMQANAFTVMLPYGTDAEVLKGLVPRFEVTEGATLNVGDEEIVSGTTKVDFSSAVDLVVKKDNSYAMYTVTVLIKEPVKWAVVARSDSMSKKGLPHMLINPKDGLPYIGGIKGTEDDTRQPVVLKYDGTQLVDLAGNLIETQSENTTIGFDPDGNVYAAFLEKIESNSYHSVVKIENGQVNSLGHITYNASSTSLTPACLCPVSSNMIYMPFVNNTRKVDLERRGAFMATYNGSAWSYGAIADRGTTDCGAFGLRCKNIDGVYYLLTLDYSAGTISMYKYDGAWSAIAKAVVAKKSNGENITSIVYQYGYLDFDVASNGDIYVICGADFNTGEKELGVICYDVETGEQTLIGGVISVDAANGRYAAIALDNNDVPHIVYRASIEDAKLYYAYIDAETKIWSYPQALLAEDVNYQLSFDFNAEGTGYILAQSGETCKYILLSNVQ